MTELAVVGDNEFVMGFELIGIKRVFEGETREMLKEAYTSALNDKSVGIIVTNDRSIDKMEINFRRQIETYRNK